MTSHHRLLLVAAVAVAVALTGCSNLNQTVPKTDVPAPTASVKPTPTPTPTPTVWSMEESAAAYLQAVCPANKMVATYNTAFDNGDLDALHTAATQAIAADQDAAKKLDEGKWPTELAPDVALVRDAYFARIPAEQATVSAPSMDAVYAIQWPDQSAASTASQRLRSRLNLSPEQLTGC